MYIKKVYIKNLWLKGDIEWNLQSDVNILVGINGSGKSTILNLVYEALQSEISDEAKKRHFSLISELVIHLSDDSFIFVDSSGDRFPINIGSLGLNVGKISTFDISSSLDDLILSLQRQFEVYKNKIYQTLLGDLNVNRLPSQEEMNRLFGRRKIFFETINRMFRETKKTFSDENFTFKLDGQQYELTCQQLSSGEKQMFYILLQTLLQDGKPTTILLDEPEISLHIEWQRELIAEMRKLNELCQIVAVTHSSNMYFSDWADKKVNIDSIRKEKTLNNISIDIASKQATFVKGIKNKQTITDVNQMLHRTFFMLSLKECRQILKAISSANFNPDHFTYTTLISKTTNRGDAYELLKEMKTKKIQPNEVTYVNILKKTDSFDEAMSVFEQMRKDKVQPAIQHFSTLLGKADNPEAVQQVEELRVLSNIPMNPIYENKLRIKK